MEIYTSNPNQKKVTIHKKECSKKEKYAMINIEALKNALNNLSAMATELWLYFAKNQNHHNFWLSMVDVRNFSGMSVSSYHRAVNELIEKGYLIKAQTAQNQYEFYEEPQCIESK